jgi:UDP-N-acetylglucosamine 2-epimerase (non-hydrolysing)
MVPGDVNSTLAGAVAANKMNIPLIHLESGLRSFDKKMPEEHNRIVADNLSDICLVTEPSGIENLQKEGLQASIFHVGNTMIDTLVKFEPQIEASNIMQVLGLTPKSYILCTFHRPSNVDDEQQLIKLVSLLETLAQFQTVVIPLHPRTLKMMGNWSLDSRLKQNSNIKITEPLGYFEFQKLIKESTVVITDSGGIQEETTFRQIPCLTLRENTERPVTITEGTNTLMKFDETEILNYVDSIIKGTYKKGTIPQFWDGHTTERIFEFLNRY